MKKYPLMWFFILGTANLFIGLTVWRFFDYFCGEPNSMNAIFGVYLGTSSIIWLVFLFAFGDKLLKKERKTRRNNFENKVKKGKTIVLVIKRRIFANFSFLFGIIAVWIFFIILFPSKEFGSIEFTIVRVLSIVWFIYGLSFSLLFHKTFIKLENNRFIISHKNGQIEVAVHELNELRLIPNLKHKSWNELQALLFADLEVELADGQKFLFSKADRVVSVQQKIKIIKKILASTKNMK